MKQKYLQHLLVAFFAAQASLVSAQSLQLQNIPGVINGDHEEYEYEVPIYVKNISNSAINVIAKREELNLAPNHVSYFCWDLCYSPDGSIGQPVTIQPGEVVTIFKSYLQPHDSPGTSKVRYSYYNADNITDSLQYTFVYQMGVSGISEMEHLVGQAFPNPAQNKVSVNLQLPGTIAPKVEVVSVIGQTVQTIHAAPLQPQVTFNVTDLAPGIYFIRTTADNKTIKMQKFTKL